MGLNLKEKWQNANKKNIVIISIVLFVIILCTIGGVEYYQYKSFKAEQAREAALMEEYSAIPIDMRQEEPKRPSEYSVGMDYNKAMKSKKPVLVLFYADWCGYCVKFMPVFKQLAALYEEDMDFAKVNVEDAKYEKLVSEIGLTGYPTVFIIDPKYDNKVLLSNAYLRSAKTVGKELDRYIRIRKILDSKN